MATENQQTQEIHKKEKNDLEAHYIAFCCSKKVNNNQINYKRILNNFIFGLSLVILALFIRNELLIWNGLLLHQVE